MSKHLEKQLKPCPYCGGRARVKTSKAKGAVCHINGEAIQAIGKDYRCVCTKCKAKTLSSLNIEQVVMFWNNGQAYKFTS